MDRLQPRVCALSGHEMFCLHHMGLQAGPLVLGNSVYALGALSRLTASISTLGGGEIAELTALMHDGRQRAVDRMVAEGKKAGGCGITGVSFNVLSHGANIEFLAQGAAVFGSSTFPGSSPGLPVPPAPAALPGSPASASFNMAGSAQDLYCYAECGFAPRQFVFGNVAYSIGVGGSILGSLTSLTRGEVSSYTEIFERTRHLALERIVREAKASGANAVLGIKTTISPLWGTQEMTMVGTAAHHRLLSLHDGEPVTSDLSAAETWNICNMGMVPLQLVMGVSVYSLGVAGNLRSQLRSFVRGEVGPLTELLYEARDRSLARLDAQAQALGATQVIGVKLRIYELRPGLVEVIGLGTAIKNLDGMRTGSTHILPQALAQDRETFVDVQNGSSQLLTRNSFASNRTVGRSLARIISLGLCAALVLAKWWVLRR